MVGFLYGIYPYYPNTILPPLFAVIVSLLSVVILYRCVRHRWWHFGIVMLWASLVWVSGFIMRAISIHQPSNLGLFVAQYVLIFSGPPLYAASESFILGRLLGYLPYHAPFHPGRVLYVFGILCAAIEALAINGASIASNSNASPAAIEGAQQRIKASLIMQEFLEAAFCGFVAYIEYKCRKARLFPRNVKIICRVIYTTSLMMMVRCIVRTVEGFATGTCDPHAPDYNGWCGPVQENEWFLWVFEVANITVFVAALAIWHPSRYLVSRYSLLAYRW